MKILRVISPEQCPLRSANGYCSHPGKSYHSWCQSTEGQPFPHFCPLHECAKNSCKKREGLVLTIDEEIDQLIIGIENLRKKLWTQENHQLCVRAAALLEDINTDKEVEP